MDVQGPAAAGRLPGGVVLEKRRGRVGEIELNVTRPHVEIQACTRRGDGIMDEIPAADDVVLQGRTWGDLIECDGASVAPSGAAAVLGIR